MAVAVRTRDTAGKNEVMDLGLIVTALKTKNSAGLQLMKRFKEKTGNDILDARLRAGNRAVHFDFEILEAPASNPHLHFWKSVEHKGSQKFTPISPEQTPWAAGVQFHNGGCEKYSIGPLYAKLWYDTLIASGALKQEWSLEAALPSYEEWYHGDAKRQGDPTTAFGKELKQKVRATRGPKASLGEKRKLVNDLFHLTEEQLATFKGEVLQVLNESLNQKYYWLTLHGNVGADFHCEWYPKFTLSSITSVKIRKELDIWFDFECPETKFSCILRWGKGAGFSNLRIDARD